MADVIGELSTDVVPGQVEVPERATAVERRRERAEDVVVGEVEVDEAGEGNPLVAPESVTGDSETGSRSPTADTRILESSLLCLISLC